MRRGRRPSGHLNSTHIWTSRGLNPQTWIETVVIDYKAPPKDLLREFKRRIGFIQTMRSDMDTEGMLGRLRDLLDFPTRTTMPDPKERASLARQHRRSLERLKKLPPGDAAQDEAIRRTRYRLSRLNSNGATLSAGQVIRDLRYVYGVKVSRQQLGRLLKLLPKFRRYGTLRIETQFGHDHPSDTK